MNGDKDTGSRRLRGWKWCARGDAYAAPYVQRYASLQSQSCIPVAGERGISVDNTSLTCGYRLSVQAIFNDLLFDLKRYLCDAT